jgi:site-specific DNA recombinase
MLSLTAFADELEREKARQRTYDAMQRKAKAGHVCGGRVFGYQNVEIVGTDGRRSHVMRTIEPTEADVIRTIFRLSAEGHGVKAIARRLNDQRAPSPRAQLGRSQTWAPSSVRAVLRRPLYRGEIVWNASRKRDQWGQHKQTARPETEWMRLPAPELRIVADEIWTAAHARQTAARAIYLHTNKGQVFGRPALGHPSKYLLTNLALCGCCGGPLQVRSGSHGNGRSHFYGCAWYHERGRTVCANGAKAPMVDADQIVIEALLDDVLDPSIIGEAIDEAVRLLCVDNTDNRSVISAIDQELATVDRERNRLVSAIASGGQLDGLLQALQAREARRVQLEADRHAVRSQRHLKASEAATVRKDLIGLADSWRRVLAEDPPNARPIVSSLLIGRVTITPLPANKWNVKGNGTLAGLFSRDLLPLVVRPHRDSRLCGRSNFPRNRAESLAARSGRRDSPMIRAGQLYGKERVSGGVPTTGSPSAHAHSCATFTVCAFDGLATAIVTGVPGAMLSPHCS